jgi:hypothetical protein
LNSSENVVSRADAGRRHVDPAGIGARVSDEVGERRGGHRRVHHDEEGVARNAGNRRDIVEEIELEIVVERRVDCIGEADEQQRVTVGGRTHDRLGGHIGPGARSVLDDELLTEPIRKPASDHACGDIDAATRGKANHDAHRPRRIGLRLCRVQHDRQNASARGQMQKLSARKLHGAVP